MECMPTMLVKLEHPERQKVPFLVRQMWFFVGEGLSL
jgi:hypothetical protein